MSNGLNRLSPSRTPRLISRCAVWRLSIETFPQSSGRSISRTTAPLTLRFWRISKLSIPNWSATAKVNSFYTISKEPWRGKTTTNRTRPLSNKGRRNASPLRVGGRPTAIFPISTWQRRGRGQSLSLAGLANGRPLSLGTKETECGYAPARN